MQRLAYPQPIIQDIANYLVNRPYGEVVGLMQGLQTQGLQVDDTALLTQQPGPAPIPPAPAAPAPVADQPQSAQPVPIYSDQDQEANVK